MSIDSYTSPTRVLTLYHDPFSSASQKVRLCLSEKGISWHSVPIDLRKQEHFYSEYLTINPKGLVPSLKDSQGVIHCGSTEINEFLNDTFPTPPLLPPEVILCQQIHELCKMQEALHHPSIRLLSYHILHSKKEKHAQKTIKELLNNAKKHPNRERRQFLIKSIKGFSKEEVDTARQKITEALEQLEQTLENSPSIWLIGKEYSLADIAWTPIFFRLEKLEISFSTYPKLTHWWKAVQKRESFQQAILTFYL